MSRIINTPRPGWTELYGNPDARAVDGDEYLVETRDGAIVRCTAAVLHDGEAEIMRFVPTDGDPNDWVDALRFVRALPQPASRRA